MIKSLVLYSPYNYDSAIPVLRVIGPAQHLGIQVLKGMDIFTGEISIECIAEADLVVIQRDFPKYVDEYEKILREVNRYGKALVYDLDDLLFDLPADHPDRVNDYYTDALLPMFHALRQADVITTATAPLLNTLRPYNNNIYILPNYLNDQIWKPLPPRNPDLAAEKVTIGYMGGSSHADDLLMITPVLESLLARYPENLLLQFWGQKPPESLLQSQSVIWENLELFDYTRFAAYFLAQTADIFIAPLMNNTFNQCKSAIKFMEYSALGIPGVYSDIHPYASIITHHKNGLLANTLPEWEACLVQLIENPELRYALAVNAQETLNQHLRLSDHAHQWMDAYLATLDIAKTSNTQEKDVLFRKTTLQVMNRITHLDKQLKITHQQLTGNNIHFEAQKSQLEEQVATLQQEKQQLEEQISSLQKEIQNIKQDFNDSLYHLITSREYQHGQELMKLVDRLAPVNSPQKQLITALYKRIRGKSKPSDATIAEATTVHPDDKPESISPIRVYPQPTRLYSRYDVIVFPIIYWNFRFQRSQQIAQQFARQGHRVFYINLDFQESDKLSINPVAQNVFEVLLPGKPVSLYSVEMDDEHHAAILQAFQELVSFYNIRLAIQKVEFPYWAPAALSLRSIYGWKIIYDCMDEISGFSTTTPEIIAAENSLANNSDLIVCTSRRLLEKKSRENSNCTLVPNAADFEHFRTKPTTIPSEIKDLRPPILGYYGAIADWFDTHLIAELAQARRNWQFILIGNTLFADLAPLQGIKNVHLLGEKPYAELPAYLHHFDVCLIPFKKTPLTEATNPVKLFEYLSAGKQVIATDLNELSFYRDYIHLATTTQEWLDAIKNALAQNTPKSINKQQAFAQKNTWDQRVRMFKAEIAPLFPKASLVILTYNKLDITQQCLDSIFAHTTYPNYEVIIVDNASSDDTPAYLNNLQKKKTNVKVILNQGNLGFAAGNNQAVQSTSGEYLVFLNSDTVVTSGWLTRLIGHLVDRQTGMVGPVTNQSGNESRVETCYANLDEMHAFAHQYTTDHAGEVFEIRMLPFLCVAMHKEIFDEIGALDERFGDGMFEDDDYAMRVRQKGYNIICAEDVFIHHWGGASFARQHDSTYQTLFEKNRLLFEEKWEKKWQPHSYRQS